MNLSLVFALAATLGFIGTVLQAAFAAVNGIQSMKAFLGHFNNLVLEERDRILKELPWWTPFPRRKAMTAAAKRADFALASDELRLSRAYDREAWGWSLLTIGTLATAVGSWMQFTP